MDKSFVCDVFVTAGPNPKGRPGKQETSMQRTVDIRAETDIKYFYDCIVNSYAASFAEMDRNQVVVAIVPAISSGVYAPKWLEISTYLKNLKSDYLPRAVDLAKALRRGQLTTLRNIILCHPDVSDSQWPAPFTKENPYGMMPGSSLMRPKCKYALTSKGCYRTKETHIRNFSHPGDDDWER